MNYGVFRSFVESEEEEEVIKLLENLESRAEIKDVKIKSANAKTVIYIVTSDRRFETQTLLNEQLSNAGNNSVIDAMKVVSCIPLVGLNPILLLAPDGKRNSVDS